MKTLDEYIIYCTEEQTKKAFELGALIETVAIFGGDRPLIQIGHIVAVIPTAEQMIGWLRDKGVHLSILYSKFRDVYNVQCFEFDGTYVRDEGGTVKCFASHKEATLAGIDAALDYLINKKKNYETI